MLLVAARGGGPVLGTASEGEDPSAARDLALEIRINHLADLELLRVLFDIKQALERRLVIKGIMSRLLVLSRGGRLRRTVREPV